MTLKTLHIRKADYADEKSILTILSKSFAENKSVLYVVKKDSKINSRIRELMRYSFRMCMAFGEVWINQDETACALMLYSEKKRMKPELDLRLLLKAISIPRVFRIMKRESEIENHHPKGNFLYLWFIGVLPSHQKYGIGSILLQKVIEFANTKQREIYLETSTVPNLQWYQNHDFEIFHQIDFDHRLFMLRKRNDSHH